jgi:hypothetical protein
VIVATSAAAMGTTSYLIVGAGAAALFFGARYMLRLNRLSNELEVATKVAIYKINLGGVDLRIEVVLKNPSGGSVKVKHPFVKIMHGTTTLASSVVKDVDIEIPQFSEVQLEPVILNVGFLSLATSVPSLLKEYRETGKLNLTVRITTTINNSIPYTKSDAITIGAGIPA